MMELSLDPTAPLLQHNSLAHIAHHAKVFGSLQSGCPLFIYIYVYNSRATYFGDQVWSLI